MNETELQMNNLITLKEYRKKTTNLVTYQTSIVYNKAKRQKRILHNGSNLVRKCVFYRVQVSNFETMQYAYQNWKKGKYIKCMQLELEFSLLEKEIKYKEMRKTK